MDKKVYQLSHEQVNFLANDLVEILQEITKTSKELQELNEKSKNFILDNDVSKLKDLLKEVSFILTSLIISKKLIINHSFSNSYLIHKLNFSIMPNL